LLVDERMSGFGFIRADSWRSEISIKLE